MKNRVGTFEVSRDLIDRDPSAVLKVMARCVIVRAEYLFVSNTVAYTALCMDFDENLAGHLAPAYRPIMERDEHGAVELLRWERVTC